jgi:DNA ligase-1
MQFIYVAHYCTRIEQESSRLGMTILLAELLHHANAQEAAIICYFSLGQLVPAYTTFQLNIAHEMMVRVIARVLDVEEQTIKQWAQEEGDLGRVIARGSWTPRQTLTLEQVYDRLYMIGQLSGAGSQEEKIQHLYGLLRELDPQSAQYVVRIVLGKLRLGFSDMTLIDALSWMLVGNKLLRPIIENAYNLCADIGMVARMVKEEGIAGLEHMRIQVGIPLRPAMAERAPSAAVLFERLGPCVAQPKLDGFRLQVHLDKRKSPPAVHFFSRHLTDMSAMFPDLVQVVLACDVYDMICEGEAIVFDSATQTFLPFQETVKRKRKHGVEQAAHEMPLRLFLFDILYLNGTSLLEKTHEERRKLLNGVVAKIANPVLQIIEEKAVHSPQELKDYFLLNIAAGLEGLVVKRPDATYQAGKRNFNWIKLKREEESHLEDTIDAVVLGYYAGEGKRSNFGIGAFLVGVYNTREDRFETIAKIGTGLKDADWIELKKKCDTISVREQPKNVLCAPELTPNVWASPEIVVTIRADEITQSPLHAAGRRDDNPGYALRFPRFIEYRTDKGPLEATRVDEIVRLFEDQKQ